MLRQTVQRLTQEAHSEGVALGIQQGVQQGIETGRQEGRREGELLGQVRLLGHQLERRFGTLDDLLRRRLETASIEQLERWGERFATAASLGDVFGD